MQMQFELGSYMHAQMKLANLQDFNPYFGWSAKVGIKSHRFARECVLFVHTWM